MREEPDIKGDIAHFYLLIVHVRARYAEILDSCPVDGKKNKRMQDARTVVSKYSNY